jgi:hypothetical protein
MPLERASITQFSLFFREKLNRRWGNQLLKGSPSSEPSALPKNRFPWLNRHVLDIEDRCRDIGKVNVALCGIPIPSKHRVDRLLKLSATRLVDTASINPKAPQPIPFGLLSAESDLLIASLALAGTIHHIFVGDLFALRPPGVRECSIWWYIIAIIIAG